MLFNLRRPSTRPINGVHGKAVLNRKSEGEARGASARLLSEVAVILFAMGCKLGRPAWARALASPLAAAAAGHLGAEVREEGSAAERAAAVAEALAAAAAESCGGPAQRWRLIGYRAAEELWLLRRGSQGLVSLPAPSPLTWCIEGLALSEAAPDLRELGERASLV